MILAIIYRGYCVSVILGPLRAIFISALEWKLELRIYLSDIQARILIYNGGQTKRKMGPFMIRAGVLKVSNKVNR